MPMRFERVVIVLIVIVAVAAAFVWFGRGRTGPATELDRPTAATEPDRPTAAAGEAALLVVGVEGFEMDIVERLVAEGRLPRVGRLLDDGALQTFANLGKTTDRGVAWTSVATGMTPENHGLGVPRTTERGAEVETEPTPSNRTAETLWTIANSNGHRVCVVGWPATWPAEVVDGLMMAPYEQYVLERAHGGDHASGVHPPEQLAAVDALVRAPGSVERRDLLRFVDLDSRLGPEALVGQNYQSLAEAYAGDRSCIDVALHGLTDVGSDVVCVYLEGLNTVSQRFWHYMDPEPFERIEARPEDEEFFEGQIEALGGTIDRYYEYVDMLLGELVDACGDDVTVAVVADHGYIGIEFDARGGPKIGQHMHSEEGVWIASGPRVAGDVTVPDGSITDFAPTVLAAAGIETAVDFDGEAQERALR